MCVIQAVRFSCGHLLCKSYDSCRPGISVQQCRSTEGMGYIVTPVADAFPLLDPSLRPRCPVHINGTCAPLTRPEAFAAHSTWRTNQQQTPNTELYKTFLSIPSWIHGAQGEIVGTSLEPRAYDYIMEVCKKRYLGNGFLYGPALSTRDTQDAGTVDGEDVDSDHEELVFRPIAPKQNGPLRPIAPRPAKRTRVRRVREDSGVGWHDTTTVKQPMHAVNDVSDAQSQIVTPHVMEQEATGQTMPAVNDVPVVNDVPDTRPQVMTPQFMEQDPWVVPETVRLSDLDLNAAWEAANVMSEMSMDGLDWSEEKPED